jgi:tRNA dimethylallyltransferase
VKDKEVSKTLVVITGPTAVGKTALTMQLAQHYGVPVINADSRQIYKELKIGTAAPTAEQLQQVHHLFVGSKSIDDYYNASMYEQEVLTYISESSAPVNLLSGGSMMYIDAVCNGIDDIPTVRDNIREEMKRRYEEEGLEALCEELKQLDPEHYAIIDRQNYRRVIHALEICHQTGKTYTSFRTQQKKERPFRIIKIGLNRNREELYNRINQRVDQMMTDGLLDEVKGLIDKRHTNALNTVGYKELFDHLDRRWPLEEAVERFKGNTRRYARKQLTWFKRDAAMKWFHPNDIQDILNYITHYE